LDLEKGTFDSAKSRLEEMESLLSDIHPSNKESFKYTLKFLEGKILLLEKSYDRAIIVLEEMLDLEDPSMQPIMAKISYNILNHREILAQAYNQKGDIDKAIATYKNLITFNPDSNDRRLIKPKNYYELAKLYEQTGQKTKAIEHYEKFLDLWKDADSGMAELEDAKRRLEGLKGI
jgi:tetratricopeptide (TPR) repeat protein